MTFTSCVPWCSGPGENMQLSGAGLVGEREVTNICYTVCSPQHTPVQILIIHQHSKVNVLLVSVIHTAILEQK